MVALAAACRDRRLTIVNALVPATIYDLVHDDAITAGMLSSVSVAGTGAAGLSEDLRSAFEAKFGLRLVGTYGMTEAPGVVCIEDADVPHAAGASGKALPHLMIGSCDERGERLPVGQEGELLVCAADSGAWAGVYRPALGTWTEHGLTRRSSHEKCFRTGDYGFVDAEGTVFVSGRKADVIVRGGVNVNAAELESVLGQLPKVRDIAVVGEPDERLGQRIVAFVELSPDATVDAAQLRAQTRGMLAHGKVPDEFVVAALPRNAMGKVALGRRAEKLKEVAALIEAGGGRSLVVPGDVAHPETAIRAAEESIREFGGVDILINNAGLHATPYPLHEMPIEEWDRFLAVDLTGRSSSPGRCCLP